MTLRADQLSAIVAHTQDTALHAALRDARAWLFPAGAEVEVMEQLAGPIGMNPMKKQMTAASIGQKMRGLTRAGPSTTSARPMRKIGAPNESMVRSPRPMSRTARA